MCKFIEMYTNLNRCVLSMVYSNLFVSYHRCLSEYFCNNVRLSLCVWEWECMLASVCTRGRWRDCVCMHVSNVLFLIKAWFCCRAFDRHVRRRWGREVCWCGERDAATHRCQHPSPSISLASHHITSHRLCLSLSLSLLIPRATSQSLSGLISVTLISLENDSFFPAHFYSKWLRCVLQFSQLLFQSPRLRRGLPPPSPLAPSPQHNNCFRKVGNGLVAPCSTYWNVNGRERWWCYFFPLSLSFFCLSS